MTRYRRPFGATMPLPIPPPSQIANKKAMQFIHSLPTSNSFDGMGLFGYTFGPLNQKDLEIYYIEVEKGHDTFMISKRITRIYYVLDGSGYFTLDGRRYDVEQGMLVEVPPKTEYSYSGKMKLIAFCRPRWFSGNDSHTKWNPDVVNGEYPLLANGAPKNMLRKLLKKSPVGLFLRLNGKLWSRLP